MFTVKYLSKFAATGTFVVFLSRRPGKVEPPAAKPAA